MAFLHLSLFTIYLIVNVVFGASQRGGDVSLQIPQGRIVGEWRESLDRRLYGAFEGIPYAKPPIGNLRFEEAQRAERWRGTLMAKRLPNVCINYHDGMDEFDEEKNIAGDEDCLYLNVYSPHPTRNGYLPVIVYIHGGGFMFGSGGDYSPKFLMDFDIVVVTINYRLGYLGFLSAEDSVLPGNLGLKDQVLALEWVRDNIIYFGGDNRKITIAGMSAGGASVHFHMMSPRSRGLFQRAISMSGTSFCPWTLQEAAVEKAHGLATNLGCPTTPTRDMVHCLKTKPALSIVKLSKLFMPYVHGPFSPMAPVIELRNSPNPFITTHPYKMVKEGRFTNDVPWLVSVVKDEGLYPAAVYLRHQDYVDDINESFDELAPLMYDYNYTAPVSEHINIAHKIKQQYLGNIREFTEDHLFMKFVDSLSDRLFLRDIVKTVKLQSTVQRSPIYFYHFSYKGATGLGLYHSDQRKHIGVSHGDDTGYVMDAIYMDPTTTTEDKKMIKFMGGIWASFATNGIPKVPVPRVNWQPVRPRARDLNYLDIQGPDRCVIKTTTTMGREAFWRTLALNENENYISRQ